MDKLGLTDQNRSLCDLVSDGFSSAVKIVDSTLRYGFGFAQGFCLYSAVPYALPTVNRIATHELMDRSSDWWNRSYKSSEWSYPSWAERCGVMDGGRVALLGSAVQLGALAYAAFTVNPAFALIPLASNAVSMAYEMFSSRGYHARGELIKARLATIRIGGGQFAFASNWLMDPLDAERTASPHYISLCHK